MCAESRSHWMPVYQNPFSDEARIKALKDKIKVVPRKEKKLLKLILAYNFPYAVKK